jgi:benzoate/toluate 1,2-dioxygenase alpha subunit
MTTGICYRDDPAAIAALVRDEAVQCDVYIDPDTFRLEMEQRWPRSWINVGPTGQVPDVGDGGAPTTL